MAIMPATEIVKLIHTEGVTGQVRAGFAALPDLEREALTKTLRQDYPVAADELAGPEAVPPPVGIEPVAPVTSDVLPDDFPGAAALTAAGLSTIDDVQAELAEHGSLTHIAGIGEATDAKIKEALKEV